MREGDCTATRLAEILPVDASRVSCMVTKLVDMGLLRRWRLRTDRRIVRLQLTDMGNELTAQLDQRVQVYDTKLLEGVSEEEMRRFMSTASKILANYTALKHSK